MILSEESLKGDGERKRVGSKEWNWMGQPWMMISRIHVQCYALKGHALWTGFYVAHVKFVDLSQEWGVCVAVQGKAGNPCCILLWYSGFLG